MSFLLPAPHLQEKSVPEGYPRSRCGEHLKYKAGQKSANPGCGISLPTLPVRLDSQRFFGGRSSEREGLEKHWKRL